MSVAKEVGAIRSSAGFSHATHVTFIRIDGPDALDFLQGASTHSPYVREGRVRHTLLLRDDGSIFADAFIVKAEESFLVLAEGPDEKEMVAWLESLKERSQKKDVTISGTKDEWVIFGVDGPYAWEVVGNLLGPAALGMPYLSLFRKGDLLCVRAGKTGEYGYLLLVPRPLAPETEEKLLAIGAPLDLAPVGLEALDVCALESWHFSMRTLRKTEILLTPIELQLQWRIVYTREFAGADALRARRAEGAKVRATCFMAERPVSPGQRVRLGELDVGEVLASCASPTLGMTVGSALLALRFAHPHLGLMVGADSIRTCTASLVDNLSLRVQPHKHSYLTRGTEVPA